MYLYASEHALMDYHLNTEKADKAKAEAEKETDKEDNETDTIKTE